ncbi:Uncharacterised protein [Leclercia adecarboxylata]|uniref:Uncharacterized protein n=1 Tax=Leclercia adecarboxylata TaxID=83655 RepID=A0A4U9HN46_9ENTR|nr:Uncharacterised protein [Leclercia adecarboxylata]
MINTVIPSCCSTAEPDITRGLSNTIDEVMQSISRAADEAMAKVQQTLDLKARELQKEQVAEGAAPANLAAGQRGSEADAGPFTGVQSWLIWTRIRCVTATPLLCQACEGPSRRRGKRG